MTPAPRLVRRRHGPTPRRQPAGFSLVELLVVLAIIAVLLAVLMPVLGRVRSAARTVACQANLRQWGDAYQLYLSANRGRSFVLGEFPGSPRLGPTPPMWWEVLKPYHPEVTRTLLCPEASDPANITPRNAFQAWGPQYFFDTPDKVRGPFTGSYGLNAWLYYSLPGGHGGPLPESIRLPNPRDAARGPVFFDCANLDAAAQNDDAPRLYNTGGPLRGLSTVALERHGGRGSANTGGGVNLVFLDGHAEYVPAPGLWRLRWSETFRPREVTIER
jgi:prepilin-type N-terminal cleavage/methylation domain-containing protein/prepilin-type processing-associated H-X9-DG protein